jgi:hypothetical protein
MKTNVNDFVVKRAIDEVNAKYGYSIKLNRADYSGKWFNFTIDSPSKVPGARTSSSGRNLAKASWHAHGYLFDEIFAIDSTAVIYSNGAKITKDSGNWIDKNIGSMYQPCYFSETSIL